MPQLFADDNSVCCCSRFMKLCPFNTCIVFRNLTEDRATNKVECSNKIIYYYLGILCMTD